MSTIALRSRSRATAGGKVACFAIFLVAACPLRAADVSVLGVSWSLPVGATDLQAGAGTDFESPVVTDVHIAFLSITNTGGASWNLRIACESSGPPWPGGVNVSLKRGGGSAEAGISNGLTYLALSNDMQAFFSGTGDYESVEILLKLDGVTAQTAPGLHSLTIRYAIEVP